MPDERVLPISKSDWPRPGCRPASAPERRWPAAPGPAAGGAWPNTWTGTLIAAWRHCCGIRTWETGSSSSGIDDDYLTALDDYYTERLPAAGERDWLGDLAGSRFVRRIAQARRRVDRARSRASDGRWLGLGRADLDPAGRVYGHRDLDRERRADRLILEASDAVAECLTEFRQIDAQAGPAHHRRGGAAAGRWTFAVGCACACRRQSRERSKCSAGWNCRSTTLAALVVAGLNEGIVPASQNGDLFLPDRLRTALALDDNDRRYARDSYALHVLAASRGAAQTDRRPAHQRSAIRWRPAGCCSPATDGGNGQRAKNSSRPAAESRRLLLPQSPRAGRAATDLPIPQPRPLQRR